jgi:hypothetical protein
MFSYRKQIRSLFTLTVVISCVIYMDVILCLLSVTSLCNLIFRHKKGKVVPVLN